MSNTITIGGTDRWSVMTEESLRIEDQLNARNTCEFMLMDQLGTARPLIGQAVIVTIAGTVRFAGTVDSFRERNVTSRFSNTYRSYRVSCVDYNQFCDRHIIADVYEHMLMIDIIRDVIAFALDDDGVTLSPDTPDGPTIEYYAPDYIQASRVFDDLSQMSGYFWYIDTDKVLHFIDRSVLVAPYTLNQSTPIDLVETLDVEHTREQYRNVQYIRGGQAVTDALLTETFKGDAETKTFSVALPVASVPIVSTDIGAGYVVRTVGIRQVDTGRDWYWQENSNQISQDSSGTVLGATHKIKVEYFGYYPLVDAARIQNEVVARIAVEGGSGLYETVENRQDITSASSSRDRAEGLLALFGAIDTRVRFATYTTGWKAGQLLTIDRAEHDIDAEFIIAQVTLEHDGQNRYLYNIRAVSGSLVENWVAFFKRLAENNPRVTRNPNQVVNLLRIFYETITLAESFTTPTSTTSIEGEVLANQTSFASALEKHTLGFSVIADLLQTIQQNTSYQSEHIGVTEGTRCVGTLQTSESWKIGLSESSMIVVNTP